MTAATAILIARPLVPAAHLGVAVVRFERGPVSPQAGRWPWYTRGVTQLTLAAQIRQLAAERGYDKLDADAQRALRREIADELGTIPENVTSALKHRGRQGRRAAPRDEHHCPTCGQTLRTQRAREEAERNAPKPAKRGRHSSK